MYQRGTQIALRGAMERQRGSAAGPTLSSKISRFSFARNSNMVRTI